MVLLFFLRLRVLLFVVAATLGSGAVIVSELRHRFNSVETTATLLERIHKCRIELSADAERRTLVESALSAARAQEAPCETAQAMQDRFGDDKVTITRVDLVRLSYVGPNGKPLETKVDADVAPKVAEIGAEFPVVYDPDRPNTLRTPATDIVLGVATAVFILGLVVLALIFGLSPGRLAGRLASASGAGRLRNDSAGNWTKAAEEAIARAVEPPPPPPMRSAPPSAAPAYPAARAFGRRAADRR